MNFEEEAAGTVDLGDESAFVIPSNLDLLVPTTDDVEVEVEGVEREVVIPNLSALSNLFNSSRFLSAAVNVELILPSSSFLIIPPLDDDVDKDLIEL